MAHITSGKMGIDLTLKTAGTTTDGANAIHTLGQREPGTDNSVWCYVQASGAITQYDYVTIDENFQAAAGTKAAVDDGHFIGYAQVAFDDNDLGWVALSGSNIRVRVASGCTADTALYTSGTAGVLDDDTTSQTKIDGVVTTTTATEATNVEIIATYPRSATF